METKELLNTLENVEEQNNTNYLTDFTIEHVENSPFSIVKEKEMYFGIIGNHRVTENFYTSKEECKKELLEINWNRLTQVIWAIVEKFKYEKEEIEKTLKEEN